MQRRSRESYIKQSYNTYLNKLADYQYKGKGLIKHNTLSYSQYRETYMNISPTNRSRLSSELASMSLTFTREEARNIAHEIAPYTDIVNSWFIDTKTAKSGNYNINDLTSKIQAMSGEEAHDFVAELIDKGVHASGRDFEEAIY